MAGFLVFAFHLRGRKGYDYAILAWLFSILLQVAPAQAGSPEQCGWKYSDYVSVTLTALAIMLAVLAIGLATAGIFGYKAIIDLASRKAEEAALKRLAEFFQAEKTSAMLKEVVLKHVQQEADKVYDDLKLTGAEIKQYPGKPENPK